MATKYAIPENDRYPTDYRRIVYDAARNGHVTKLRNLLKGYPLDVMKDLMQHKTGGQTPLQAALLKRKPGVTRYLIEECDAHIGQVRLATFY